MRTATAPGCKAMPYADTRMPRISADSVAGVVLCGGRSSRMGTDKSLLEYRGLPLSEHMSSLLRLAGMNDVFISGPQGIPDALAGLGPLGGLHACVEALAGKFCHVLFVPTDMPLLNLQRLRMLAFHAGTADALYYSNHVFPLRLSLSAQTRSKLAAQLIQSESSRRSIKDFIGSLSTQSLPLSDSELECFVNINTPQEWRALNSKFMKPGMPA